MHLETRSTLGSLSVALFEMLFQRADVLGKARFEGKNDRILVAAVGYGVWAEDASAGPWSSQNVLRDCLEV